MAVDVVCGMEVDAKQAPAQADYRGQTYYFCSDDCKQAFEESPEDFVSALGPEEEAA